MANESNRNDKKIGHDEKFDRGNKIDRTKIETGEISERQDQTGKLSGLEYNDDFVFNDRLGTDIDLDTQSVKEDQALLRAQRLAMNNRRDQPVEQFPHDSIELGKGPKNPHKA